MSPKHILCICTTIITPLAVQLLSHPFVLLIKFQYISSVYVRRFHWILIVLQINKSRVTVFDSLRKDPSDYQSLIDVMNKAWARFVKEQIGVSQTDELVFRTNFPVCLLSFTRRGSFFHPSIILRNILHVHLVFEAGTRKQLVWILRMRVHPLIYWPKRNDRCRIRCT